MSKYIKLEDAIEAYNQAVTLLVESEMEEFNLGDFTECSFNTTQIKLIARMIESLPTIEIPTELNGVILKDCDKVIAPFLEEHECDELWETVRALRDFYDWVTEEERKDND